MTGTTLYGRVPELPHLAFASLGSGCALLDSMSGDPLPDVPAAADFRALAASSPWRFTTLHFTHRAQDGSRSTAMGEPVEAWLDRRIGRVTVRSSGGVGIAEGAPYGVAVRLVGCNYDDDDGVACAASPHPDTEVVRRPDGLVARRPAEWHYDHGDPMWRDYRWTAMLDPAELSRGVEVRDVAASVLRGRLTWSATCRPLIGPGEEWGNGYEPRCGCCPLLDSLASRIPEYGPEDPTMIDGDLPTEYSVRLDVQTGIVVAITPLNGTGGTILSNEIHTVDEPLDPPR